MSQMNDRERAIAICKLATEIRGFFWNCKDCPKRIEPNRELREKGLSCAYQKIKQLRG